MLKTDTAAMRGLLASRKNLSRLRVAQEGLRKGMLTNYQRADEADYTLRGTQDRWTAEQMSERRMSVEAIAAVCQMCLVV